VNLVIGWSALIAAIFVLFLGTYSWGHHDGYQEGFEKGESWWWTMLRECESEREKLWREELRK
jgi:hypothetical protein